MLLINDSQRPRFLNLSVMTRVSPYPVHLFYLFPLSRRLYLYVTFVTFSACILPYITRVVLVLFRNQLCSRTWQDWGSFQHLEVLSLDCRRSGIRLYTCSTRTLIMCPWILVHANSCLLSPNWRPGRRRIRKLDAHLCCSSNALCMARDWMSVGSCIGTKKRMMVPEFGHVAPGWWEWCSAASLTGVAEVSLRSPHSPPPSLQ